MKLEELLEKKLLPQSLIVSTWTEEVLEQKLLKIFANEFQDLDHPDLMFLRPSGESYRLHDFDQLDSFIYAYPQFHHIRIVYIHMAEKLSLNCANRLLKALEEPSPSTHFILGTTAKRRLLATIRSRCLELSLGENTPRRDAESCFKQILLGIDKSSKPQDLWQKALETAEAHDTASLLTALVCAYHELLKEGQVDYLRSLHIGSQLRSMWRACMVQNTRLNPKLCIERLYMENNPFWNRTIL
jgi:hypothetical protein